ncbi:tumor susceptibility gene 101 protein-like [Atheta coriaria]|uniref:tumor susceptibility gene 101 protein-like n=1 Tax=Dalotia coriaria TaxID=877792 RepID=UPI0031F37B66
MVYASVLRQWLGSYKTPDSAITDIVTATNQYKGLEPLLETYTFNDGSSLQLVNLTGTIPVRYKGNTYNIPIKIWLMDTHPRNAPICYVKPTSDMSIKVSIYVDQNGKIYLPYLHDWKPNDSDLLGVIQVMIMTFGEHPPVFARPKQPEVAYPNNPYASQGATNQFPPYPTGPGFSSYGGYPPYPPINTNVNSGAGSGFGGGYPPYQAPYPPAPGYPVPGAGLPSHIPGQGVNANAGTIKDEHIRESLLSAIEDKLMRRMKEQYQQNRAELDTLKKTQYELKQGKAKLDSILEQLAKEKSDLDKNILVLKDKEQELEKAIERLSNQEAIDVDDAVTTTAPLYKQLLNAFAEEAALEDAIYYMGEALRCGVIDLDVFLKQVRTLSRKQFMLRALMQKCRQKAGLMPV